MEAPIKAIENTILGFNYQEVQQWVVKMGTDLLVSVLLLVLGFWFANLASRGIKNVLKKSNTDESLITFLASLSSTALKLLVVITSITQFGIEMTSFVALLGAAGLAIGMAFSGTLSNFAGGVMILVFKPFRVGDTILSQGSQGTVKEIQIFNTYLHTPDNKVVILPNGPIANGNITNFTKANNRRIDFVFTVTSGVSFEQIKSKIEDLILADTLIVKDPKPFVGLGLVKPVGIEIHVRVWVNTDDYSPVFYRINEQVYALLLLEGIFEKNTSSTLDVN